MIARRTSGLACVLFGACARASRGAKVTHARPSRLAAQAPRRIADHFLCTSTPTVVHVSPGWRSLVLFGSSEAAHPRRQIEEEPGGAPHAAHAGRPPMLP